MTAAAETRIEFACFGSRAAVYVGGDRADGRPPEISAEDARRKLLAIHARLSRFRADSELSRLNADARTTVPAGPLLRRFAQAVVDAARMSDGLVDATLLDELEAAGYAGTLEGDPGLGPAAALAGLATRSPAGRGSERWRTIEVDELDGTIARAPGVRLDSGGLAKGLAADIVGEALAEHPCYAVDCAGDLRIGGSAGVEREVRVEDPFSGETIATYAVAAGGIATSGIGRRTWRSGSGAVHHHLLDPSTGRPAYTGVVQVTALAPTALEAEVRAKTALLRGPRGAADALPFGGLAVLDDGSVERVPDRAAMVAPVAT